MNTVWSVLACLAAILIWPVPGPAFAQFPDQWTRDPGNPIRPELGGCVLFHDGVYKMWGGLDGFSYATSTDGRVWDTHPASPVLVPGPDWYDVNEIANAAVVIVDGTYHMWYSGIAADQDSRIAYATSPDGIQWTKHGANPVMDLAPPGSLDEDELIHPFVIHEDPLFRMWYNGVGGSPSEQRILYAESLDGVVWTRSPVAALDLGPPGDWDDTQLYMMCVLRVVGSYYMFYTASNTSQEFGIGLATSPDGISCSRRTPSEPVFVPGEPGAWDDLAVARPVVLATDTDFTMWYGGTRDFSSFSWGLATASSPTSVAIEAGQAEDHHISVAWPNPSSGTVSLDIVSPRADPAAIDVTDVLGRNVWSGIWTAGTRRIEWSGRDHDGEPVSPGVYFLRVSLGDERYERKVVIVR